MRVSSRISRLVCTSCGTSNGESLNCCIRRTRRSYNYSFYSKPPVVPMLLHSFQGSKVLSLSLSLFCFSILPSFHFSVKHHYLTASGSSSSPIFLYIRSSQEILPSIPRDNYIPEHFLNDIPISKPHPINQRNQSDRHHLKSPDQADWHDEEPVFGASKSSTPPKTVSPLPALLPESPGFVKPSRFGKSVAYKVTNLATELEVRGAILTRNEGGQSPSLRQRHNWDNQLMSCDARRRAHDRIATSGTWAGAEPLLLPSSGHLHQP